MTQITEGNLTFTFDANCQVAKYDEWSFYRNQFQKTCGGEKAVDFVCIKGDVLWLIEVKDYRRPNTKKVLNLHKSLAKKVRDTLAGLVAAYFNANNPLEQKLAASTLKTTRLNLVFHIEQSMKVSKLFPRAINPADLVQKLKSQLKAIDAHPKITDQYTINANIPWTVS